MVGLVELGLSRPSPAPVTRHAVTPPPQRFTGLKRALRRKRGQSLIRARFLCDVCDTYRIKERLRVLSPSHTPVTHPVSQASHGGRNPPKGHFPGLPPLPALPVARAGRGLRLAEGLGRRRVCDGGLPASRAASWQDGRGRPGSLTPGRLPQLGATVASGGGVRGPGRASLAYPSEGGAVGGAGDGVASGAPGGLAGGGGAYPGATGALRGGGWGASCLRGEGRQPLLCFRRAASASLSRFSRAT
jgi:hypothetical protein